MVGGGQRIVQVVDGSARLLPELGAWLNEGECELKGAGVGYGVVAVMGPQSSGKSTLMNRLWRTSFQEMDAQSGRSQTTQGIWASSYRSASEEGGRPVLVLDLEGSDGRERGAEDTAFERQASLLALALSDVLLVNMWCHDVGREHGAGKPLLRTVFQVHLQLFPQKSGERGAGHKTKLHFVIRDKTKTPLEKLEEILRADMDAIWDGIAKPDGVVGTVLSDFFAVSVSALPNPEVDEALFDEAVNELRGRLLDGPDALLSPGASRDVPVDALPVSVGTMWDAIVANRDLDLPSHAVMVATVRCGEIAGEVLVAAEDDLRGLEAACGGGGTTPAGQGEEEAESMAAAAAKVVADFGPRAGSIASRILGAYDEQTALLDRDTVSARRAELKADVFARLKPLFDAQVRVLGDDVMGEFAKAVEKAGSSKTSFATHGERCYTAASDRFRSAVEKLRPPDAPGDKDWDVDRRWETLSKKLKQRAWDIRQQKITDTTGKHAKALVDLLKSPVAVLFEDGKDDAWSAVRSLCDEQSDVACSALAEETRSHYDLTAEEEAEQTDSVREAGKQCVEHVLRDAARMGASSMRERFANSFQRDPKTGLVRTWAAHVDIESAAVQAQHQSLRLCALLAILWPSDAELEKVRSTLASLLPHVKADKGGEEEGEGDIEHKERLKKAKLALVQSSWDGIEQGRTVLSPQRCKALWEGLKGDADGMVAAARTTQQALKTAAQHGLPPWAIAVMVMLGWNEAWSVIMSPVKLLLVLIVGLAGFYLYEEFKVGERLQAGTVVGGLQILNDVRQRIDRLSGGRSSKDAVQTPVSSASPVPRRDKKND